MGIVAPVRRGRAMGFQLPFPIPLLQRIRCSTDEFAKFFRRINVVHTYILLLFNMFFNTAIELLACTLPYAISWRQPSQQLLQLQQILHWTRDFELPGDEGKFRIYRPVKYPGQNVTAGSDLDIWL